MKKRLRHRCCTLNFANLKDNVFPKLHYLTFLTYMYGQSLVYSLIKLSVPCGVAIIPKNMKDKELCNYSWGKVFKGGLSKFCGRQPLKNLLSLFLNICPSYWLSVSVIEFAVNFSHNIPTLDPCEDRDYASILRSELYVPHELFYYS